MQEGRICDVTAFFAAPGPGEPGRLLEAGLTEDLSGSPAERAALDYFCGKAG